MRLEDIEPGSLVSGIDSASPVTVIAAVLRGHDSLEVTYKTPAGSLGQRMLYRADESRVSLATVSRWSFEAPAADLKLAAEARRISLAARFDPYLAVRTSAVEPLPHQISAVYQHMLPQLPLRFLLADDPGAGKTVMTGLLVKEMLARGDLERCLIVAPGSLCEQWQDELYSKFGLTFDILTNDAFEAAATRNAFLEHSLAIARLDKLARSEDIQAKLQNSRWDLVVVDEAHKLSATLYGSEVKYTKRFQLGQLLSTLTENLLLLTATPHNGKPEDFQLFLSLLDPDRFEGAKRHGRDPLDTSDIMRRLVKESLLRFDGTPLFPERRAYTVNYSLSSSERALYEDVTAYVTGEFNRADRLEGKRKNSVGFALTMLQRRLASSPEAICQSLHRRRRRLEERLAEARREGRVGIVTPDLADRRLAARWSADDFDEDDIPLEDREEEEERLTDSATTAQTVMELEAEISTLAGLERQADRVRQSGEDRKWDEVSSILQDNPEMFGPEGREKLIIFTEHKDTLGYLQGKISALLGDAGAVVAIRGGMGRDVRREVERRFTQDPAVRVLIATDAAGEGINLQRAHLMICYDLPWNPNRLEQRFGRIHRIGQTEVCHLWNLVSAETREGQVYQRLLSKLESERHDLGGRVFDILGSLTFDDAPLRDLLLQAVRYGDDPAVRERLNHVVDTSLDADQLRRLLDARSLTRDTLTATDVRAIREDMERAEAQKLEPHFVASFFRSAFRRLGGVMLEREPGRYQLVAVPQRVVTAARGLYSANVVLEEYERVCFDRVLANVPGLPQAEFVYPGHPLLGSLIQVVLEEWGGSLDEGAILVDDADWGADPRCLFFVETALCDGRSGGAVGCGKQPLSIDLRFVELAPDGTPRSAGFAPYLDYRAPKAEELEAIRAHLGREGLRGTDLERVAEEYAASSIAPELLEAARRRRRAYADKVEREVTKRLRAEIRYWDGRANELEEAERAGRHRRNVSAAYARKKANDLEGRLHARAGELALMRDVYAEPARVSSAALVVPRGLLAQLMGRTVDAGERDARRAIEAVAMDAVMRTERDAGNEPEDVSATNCGYDVLSRLAAPLPAPHAPCQRFIEVKGYRSGRDEVTVSRNELLCALNNRQTFVLALCEVGEDFRARKLTYLANPFEHEPDATSSSITFNIARLRAHARELPMQPNTQGRA